MGRRESNKQKKLRFFSERLKIAFRLLVQGRDENIDESALTNKIGTPLKRHILKLIDSGKKAAKQLINVSDGEKADLNNNLTYHCMQLHHEDFSDAEEICGLSEIPELFSLLVTGGNLDKIHDQISDALVFGKKSHEKQRTGHGFRAN